MSVRITEVSVGTSIQPTNGNARVTLAVIETSIQPAGNVRVTEAYVETSILFVAGTTNRQVNVCVPC